MLCLLLKTLESAARSLPSVFCVGRVCGTVLTREADGLVGSEVAYARVAGGEYGEPDDNSYVYVSL